MLLLSMPSRPGICYDVGEVDLEITVMLMRQMESSYFPDQSTSLLAFSNASLCSFGRLRGKTCLINATDDDDDDLSRSLISTPRSQLVFPPLKSQSTPVVDSMPAQEAQTRCRTPSATF